MPYEIKLEHPLAGYAAKAARAGETAPVSVCEFTSTEDGQHFIQRLEGAPSVLLERLPLRVSPSTVDNMLAVCNRNGETTVYLNELDLRSKVRAARPVRAGDAVFKDDIADIEDIDVGVRIPDNAGFLFVFSVGWRKGLFYDFRPLAPNREPRPYDVGRILAQAYCHLLFQERFSLSDSEWNLLFESKWFPFVGLNNHTIERLLRHVRDEWDPDEILDDVVCELKSRSTQMLRSWCDHPSLSPHAEILKRAVDRFQSDDAMSCAGLLFPRIEGILRTHHNSLATECLPTPGNLSEMAVTAHKEREKCLLLPHRFNDYLRNVYFADFDPSAQDIGISRHTVGHGVANTSEFNAKAAVIGLLIVHQLFYFLENGQRPRR